MERYYPSTQTKVTDPFYNFECIHCGRKFWGLFPESKIVHCGELVRLNDKDIHRDELKRPS